MISEKGRTAASWRITGTQPCCRTCARSKLRVLGTPETKQNLDSDTSWLALYSFPKWQKCKFWCRVWFWQGLTIMAAGWLILLNSCSNFMSNLFSKTSKLQGRSIADTSGLLLSISWSVWPISWSLFPLGDVKVSGTKNGKDMSKEGLKKRYNYATYPYTARIIIPSACWVSIHWKTVGYYEIGCININNKHIYTVYEIAHCTYIFFFFSR